jgi:flagellar biosynthesis anti-sigma factor FlgM
MRVDNYGIIPCISRVRTSGTTGVEGASRPTGDSVELSAHVAAVGSAREALAHVPDVREDLVAELRQQLTAGTLVADGDSLAAKLLGEAESKRDAR